MKGFWTFILNILNILGIILYTFLGGLVIFQMARFGHVACSYRLACAISLFLSYAASRIDKSESPVTDEQTQFLDWLKSTMTGGFYILLVLMFGWFFSLTSW